MTTNINVTELVEAFRAQEQERIDAEKERRRQLSAKAHAEAVAGAVLLGDLLPKVQEIYELLPDTHKHTAPYLNEVEPNSAQRAIYFTLRLPCAHGQPFIVDRIISTWQRPEDQGGARVYELRPGERGGLLLSRELSITSCLNPADILVQFAALAGRLRASR